MEIEYVVASLVACQTVWMRRVLFELLQEWDEPIQILCDKKSIIVLWNNNVFHKINKHVDTLFHFIKKLTNIGEVSLEFNRSQDQLVDVFTKPFEKWVFQFENESLAEWSLEKHSWPYLLVKESKGEKSI